MASHHAIITRVWIEPGCIVCDACSNDCPEVFDVRDTGCEIRPAVDEAMLANLTPSIETAAAGCPVDVIKFETREVASAPSWPMSEPESDQPPMAAQEHRTLLPAEGAKGAASSPPAGEAPHVSRRRFSLAVAVGWTAVAAAGVLCVPMFQDFMSHKTPRDRRRHWRVGPLENFLQPGSVSEPFKRTPDGGPGFWLVNLAQEKKLVALSVICTHLGCIPDWQAGDAKFKCPCHGSGFSVEGINLEGPAPRPLERFGIRVDAEGYVVVDQSKVYREELGQWEEEGSYVKV